MRTVLVGLALLAVVPSLDAVPAPDPARLPKQKLEALKTKLTDVLDAWVKKLPPLNNHYGIVRLAALLRRVRALGPAEAKVVVHIHYIDDKGNKSDEALYILTVNLTYYDGLWTAARFQWSMDTTNHPWTESTHFLMDAIDEAAEKP